MQRKQTRNRHAAGFSILELLLVLVILAILAGIVGVRFAGQSGKAKVRAAQTQITELGTALGIYEQQMGAFPTTQQGLDALYENPGNLDDWDGPYLTKRVDADPWGKEWIYRSPGTQNEQDYDLYSAGPDGVEGGDDDVTNWSEDE